ncbi:MAG: hypothetical protein ABIL09_03835, partial [Gemmatimonadota bacterium]
MPASLASSARAARLGAAGLGVASLVTQVLLLREFLHLLGGNELVLGLLLGQWLLLTGLGSLLGSRSDPGTGPAGTAAAQGAVAVLPLVQIVAVRLLKAALSPGLVPGLGVAFAWSLPVLAPFCLVSGYLLARLAGQVRAPDEARAVGQVYALDSAGSVVGGVLFAFLLARHLSPLQVAALLLALNAAAAAATLWAAGRRRSGAAVGAALLLALAGLHRADLEARTLGLLYPGQDLVFARSTRYGALAVTRAAGQLTVYADGVPLGSTGDRGPAEEAAHWALAQVAAPRAVLVISGGLSGVLEEVARHRPGRLDYAEADPDAAQLLARLDPAALAGVTARAEDGRRAVETAAPGTWDAILVCLPPPSTAELNRYYTAEFFTAARRALRPGGVLGLALAGAENYASPQARSVAAAVGAALAGAFPEVLVVPGDPLRLVVGDRPLSLDVAARLRERGIEARYLRPEYLEARLAPDRVAAARAWLAGDGARVPPNRDLHPAAYLAQVQYGLARGGGRLLWPALFLVGALVLGTALVAGHADRAVAAAVAGSGVAGLGLEVVLLIGFQVTCGYVYHQVALMAAAFLAGAALGAAWSGRTRGAARALLARLDA